MPPTIGRRDGKCPGGQRECGTGNGDAQHVVPFLNLYKRNIGMFSVDLQLKFSYSIPTIQS